MAKSAKKTSRAGTKKVKKTKTSKLPQSKVKEYVSYLVELHKLQGVLLNDLQKEV